MCVQCEYHERGSQALSVRSACVSSVLYTCVHACEALCSERVDAAHPGALAVQTSFVFARWSGGVLFCTAKVKSTSEEECRLLSCCSVAYLSTGRGSLAAAQRTQQCVRTPLLVDSAHAGSHLSHSHYLVQNCNCARPKPHASQQAKKQ